MTNVRVQQLGSDTHTETYTLTATLGEDEFTWSVREGDAIDLTIPCDSLTIDRSGTFTEVVINPDPLATVCLTSSQPLVFVHRDYAQDSCFVLFVLLFAWLTFRLLS